MAYRRRSFACDLQLRDSSRFARDSLLATPFYGAEPNCSFFQSAVALVPMWYLHISNAFAKIRKSYRKATAFLRNPPFTQRGHFQIYQQL
jgi:hypothetical protein